jgi:hypothetical protein
MDNKIKPTNPTKPLKLKKSEVSTWSMVVASLAPALYMSASPYGPNSVPFITAEDVAEKADGVIRELRRRVNK